MSYRMSTPEHRLDGVDLVLRLRDGLLNALFQAKKFKKIRQADIARELGVDRAVITRQLKGEAEIGAMRIGEIASILGYRVNVNFERIDEEGSNYSEHVPLVMKSGSGDLITQDGQRAKGSAPKAAIVRPSLNDASSYLTASHG